MYRQFIKPILDRLIALIALVNLSPIFGVLYILVWRKRRRPVLFGQERTWLRYLSHHSPNPFRRHGIRLEGIRKSRHQV